METLTDTLLGLQIGFLTTAAVFAYRIMRLEFVPSSPYYTAIAALSLMSLWRVDILFDVIPDTISIIGTTLIALCWMSFFIQIFTLITKKIR